MKEIDPYYHHRRMDQRWGRIKEILPPGKGVCLDLGAGSARNRATIEELGYEWLGLDIAAHPAITVQADGACLPFRSMSFDVVLMWQTLEHLQAPWHVLEESLRVLKPGGLLAGSVSFTEPLHSDSRFHFSPLGLVQILNETGFQVKEVRPGASIFVCFWHQFLGWTGRDLGGLMAKLFGTPLMLITIAFLRGVAKPFLHLTRRWQALSPADVDKWIEAAPLRYAGQISWRAIKPLGGASGS